jgi:hypothetical protein
MVVDLIEIEPHTRDAMVALIMVGLVGFAIVRMWPRALIAGLALPLVITVALSLRIVGLVYAGMSPEALRYLTRRSFWAPGQC